jgi:hypothetical protein
VSERPWRERLELGLAIKDEMGPNWIAVEGEDFFEQIQLAVSLTEKLSADWVAVFCYCGSAEKPVSGSEIATALKLDLDAVHRCLLQMEEEKLVEATLRAGTYVFTARRRTVDGQNKQASAAQ